MGTRYSVQEGIVLRRSELPSGDLVVTLLSETRKWRAVARKGKLVGGNMGKLSLFYNVTVQQYSRPGQGEGDLGLITQVQLNGALPRLSDPSVYPYAHVLAELTDKLSAEVHLDSGLYRYFAGALRGLSSYTDPEAVALVMSWRLLAQAGLAPRMTRCARCGDALEEREEGTYFDVSAGGFSCARCGGGFQLAEGVGDDLAAFSRLSVREALERPLDARRAHWSLLGRYLSYHVGELRSLNGLALNLPPSPTPALYPS